MTASPKPLNPLHPRNPLPRWRGFNLLDMFSVKSEGLFREDDFRLVRDWGFDFVRLPMNYRLWTEPDDVLKVKEAWLEKIDGALDLARDFGLHVCLNFHRAPGFSVSDEVAEPWNLWKDDAALEAFRFHWELFTKRYIGVPSAGLSFNLVNEPKTVSDEMSREDHERVMRSAARAIHSIDPDRLIILDGLGWGREPLPELVDLGVCQSCRGYDPHGVSHHRASWVKASGDAPEPVWPGIRFRGETWDRARLEALYAPWADMIARGIGVHCGEMGCYNRTSHPVALAWLRDVLEIITGHGIGWALWNLRGSFGVLDSGREDVAYESTPEGELDRALLDLLTEF